MKPRQVIERAVLRGRPFPLDQFICLPACSIPTTLPTASPTRAGSLHDWPKTVLFGGSSMTTTPKLGTLPRTVRKPGPNWPAKSQPNDNRNEHYFCSMRPAPKPASMDSTMSKQALDSAQTRDGLKDVLLGPGQLYEALRWKGGSGEGIAPWGEQRPV